MIWAWIFILIGLFTVSVGYFELTGPVIDVLEFMETLGAPADIIARTETCYHTGFIILGVGLIVYGLIYSLKKENDTYQI